MGNSITFVKAWRGEAIYINNKLALESEEITARDVIPLMMHLSFDGFDCYRAKDTWLDEVGGDFPENLAEVVEEGGLSLAEYWEQF